MQSFTRRIDFGPQYSTVFSFSRIYIVGGHRYHVSVMDEDGVYHYFDMDFKNDRWRIVDAPKVPDWIMQVQEQLETAILENREDQSNSASL